MYFIEILSKIFKRNKKSNIVFADNSLEGQTFDDENCKHMFVPIDSTKKVFACINCGLVIKGKPKNINFFEGDK